MMKKLNLGSGEFKKEGYINVDYFSTLEPDVKHDLNIFPYPFQDNEFDLVEADHVLEHLNQPFEVMKEIHRITKNGGKVIIKVPHFSKGFTHPEHKCGFDITFPLYFNKLFPGNKEVEFKLNKIRFNWSAQPYLKKLIAPKYLYYSGIILGKIINLFANLSPVFCSRIWCFWVGGFEEISFEFQVIKEDLII